MTEPSAIAINVRDNVVTVTRNIARGEVVRYRMGDEWREVVAVDAVPFGHKIAIERIAEGEVVRKYGESIGGATRSIEPGRHVHSHNAASLRALTDQLEGIES